MKNRIKSLIALTLITTSLVPIKAYALPNLDGLSNEEKIQIIDNEISNTLIELEKVEEDIEKAEKELEEKNILLVDIQREHDLKRESLNNQSSFNLTNSINGELEILEMLLNSNSISEFFKNIELSKKIIQHNNKSLQDLEIKEEQLVELKEDINNTQIELEENEQFLEDEMKELDEMKEMVEEAIQEELRLSQQIIYNPNFSNDFEYPTNTNVSDKAKAVIDYAKKFLGVPYVWGGSSPSGFDCSGFTSYVYRNSVGVNLPRVASSQQNFGIKVPLNSLQVGDMVFMGYPAHHVGIYIGNGQMIHAPRTGDVVKIASLNWFSVSSATRVF